MSIVDFDTCTWSDPWVQELPPLGKLLFNYLWTNNHKNVACLYAISYKTIKDETGLSQKQVEDTLSILYPKVIYDPAQCLVFVVNHVKRSYLRTGNISPKIIQAIKRNLMSVTQSHFFIGIFLQKYKDLNIEYPYPIDTLPEGYRKGINTLQVQERVQGSGKGKGKEGVQGEKKQYLEFVYLSDEEHKKLFEKFGEQDLKIKIAELNDGIGSKGYKYNSHYYTILSWHRKHEREGKKKFTDKKALNAAGQEMEYLK